MFHLFCVICYVCPPWHGPGYCVPADLRMCVMCHKCQCASHSINFCPRIENHPLWKHFWQNIVTRWKTHAEKYLLKLTFVTRHKCHEFMTHSWQDDDPRESQSPGGLTPTPGVCSSPPVYGVQCTVQLYRYGYVCVTLTLQCPSVYFYANSLRYFISISFVAARDMELNWLLYFSSWEVETRRHQEQFCGLIDGECTDGYLWNFWKPNSFITTWNSIIEDDLIWLLELNSFI